VGALVVGASDTGGEEEERRGEGEREQRREERDRETERNHDDHVTTFEKHKVSVMVGEGGGGNGGQYRVMPLLVAMMSTGDRSLSSARFRKEKHSMSSMCTSSMNSTW